VIVRAANEDDIVAALGFARKHKIPFCVLSGGHGVRCMVDKSLVVDLQDISQVDVNAEAKTVTIGGELAGNL